MPSNRLLVADGRHQRDHDCDQHVGHDEHVLAGPLLDGPDELVERPERGVRAKMMVFHGIGLPKGGLVLNPVSGGVRAPPGRMNRAALSI